MHLQPSCCLASCPCPLASASLPCLSALALTPLPSPWPCFPSASPHPAHPPASLISLPCLPPFLGPHLSPHVVAPVPPCFVAAGTKPWVQALAPSPGCQVLGPNLGLPPSHSVIASSTSAVVVGIHVCAHLVEAIVVAAPSPSCQALVPSLGLAPGHSASASTPAIVTVAIPQHASGPFTLGGRRPWSHTCLQLGEGLVSSLVAALSRQQQAPVEEREVAANNWLAPGWNRAHDL